MTKENKKIYITLLIFTLLSLFLVIFCINPLMNGIEKSSKDLILAKNDIATLNAEAAEIDNFKQSYDIYKPNLDKIDQMFVDIKNPVDFIKFLEDTAASCHATSHISLPSSYQQSAKNFIDLQIFSSGGFSDVLSFLKKIENGPYLVEVENLTIQNSEAQQNTEPAAKSSAKNIVSKDYSSRKVDANIKLEAFIKK
jgi:hypothetical protein